MNTVPRRAFVAGTLAVGTTEALSLAGAFDHRRAPEPYARERLLAALAAASDAPALFHIGHSTHLISVGGRRFLTDPWFFDPAFGALTHAHPPACAPEDLERLDAVLVSHDHPDHADLRALDRLRDKTTLCALVATDELARKLRALGYTNVRTLSTWETHAFGAVLVHAVPARHDVPEIGFVVSAADASVYFAGDTAHHGEFSAIAERFRPTFAILPVDGTRLRGSDQATLNAPEAVSAARELGVRGVMPSHVEANFTDPIAEQLLSTSANGGAEVFRREMRRRLPGVRCDVPAPGARVPV